MKKFLIFSAFLFTVGLGPLYADASKAYDVLGEIPVQHGGRVRPFTSFAREAALYVTGKTSFEGFPSDQLVWEWMIEPEKWNTKPMIKVSYKPLRKEFGIKLVGKRMSPEVILGDTAFAEKVQKDRMKRQQKETLSNLERKRLEVYEKALFFRRLGEGAFPGWIPHPEEIQTGWFAFQTFMPPEGRQWISRFYPEENIDRVHQAVHELFSELREDKKTEPSENVARNLKEAFGDLLNSKAVYLDDRVLSFELQYLRIRPFGWAWKLYLAAGFIGVLMSLMALRKKGPPIFLLSVFKKAFIASFLAGLFMHTYGFYLRCVIAGRPPVSNMYESVVWVSWGVAFFAIILSFFCRGEAISVVAAFVSMLSLIVAESLPAYLDASLSPLVPVLRSNLWLTVHVLTITLSYAAFALAWGLAHVAIYRFALSPESKEKNQQMVRYLYRSIQVGVILLAAGTVLGGVWANYSWGRFWGWDPKETWALIALLGYVLILHGRLAGWLDGFFFSLGTVLAFLGIIMAWYGVNFVLAAGLHSYGFGGGGLHYVLAVIGVDLLIVAFGVYLYKRKVTLPS